jgi:hypothetical protein
LQLLDDADANIVEDVDISTISILLLTPLLTFVSALASQALDWAVLEAANRD